MNDKQLVKQCLTYLKRGKQPITRDELIKALEQRLVEPEPFIMIKRKGTMHQFADVEAALTFMRQQETDWK